MKKTIRNLLLILGLSIIAGFLLLSLSFALPFRWPEKLRAESILSLTQEGLYPADTFSGRSVDNWADCYSLLIASYDGDETPFEKASGAYFYSGCYNPYDWITGRTDSSQSPAEKVSYSRYWHGYLLILRPLMSFLNLNGIRLLNMVYIAVLVIMLLIVLQRNIPKSVFPFLFTLYLLAPSAVGKCLEYSGVFYIMLFMSLAIAGDWKYVSDRAGIRYLFLAGGILTAYVDFLTAPTLTLSIPLVFLCLRKKGETDLVSLVFSCIIYWGIGYAGMWAGKWIIAFFFQHRAFINELLFSVRQRSSSVGINGEGFARSHGLVLNIKHMLCNSYADLLIIIYAGLSAAWSLLNKKITSSHIKSAALLLIPAGIAICWYLIFTNHSVIHYRLHTYRTGVPAVFGLLCALDLGDLTRPSGQACSDLNDS